MESKEEKAKATNLETDGIASLIREGVARRRENEAARNGQVRLPI